MDESDDEQRRDAMSAGGAGGGAESGETGEQRAGDDDPVGKRAEGAGSDFEGIHARDEDEDEDEEEEDEADDDHFESVVVEITGLSLYTHHGVSEAEREVGQRLVLDLRLELGESDATVTDRIEDTVDYAEVCQLVTLIAQQRSHKTLERLCSTIADRLVADYEVASVWVKATKPEPPIALPVEEVSVEVWRDPPE